MHMKLVHPVPNLGKVKSDRDTNTKNDALKNDNEALCWETIEHDFRDTTQEKEASKDSVCDVTIVRDDHERCNKQVEKHSEDETSLHREIGDMTSVFSNCEQIIQHFDENKMML